MASPAPRRGATNLPAIKNEARRGVACRAPGRGMSIASCEGESISRRTTEGGHHGQREATNPRRARSRRHAARHEPVGRRREVLPRDDDGERRRLQPPRERAGPSPPREVPADAGLSPGGRREQVQRLVLQVRDQGGPIAGKVHCEYFCFSGGSHTSAAGPVHNPRKMGYSAGGSSSGSAAVVAAGEVEMAIGGDQGGSIRIPAAYCGIYGMKPTYGLVPYTGIFPIENTLDHT